MSRWAVLCRPLLCQGGKGTDRSGQQEKAGGEEGKILPRWERTDSIKTTESRNEDSCAKFGGLGSIVRGDGAVGLVYVRLNGHRCLLQTETTEVASDSSQIVARLIKSVKIFTEFPNESLDLEACQSEASHKYSYTYICIYFSSQGQKPHRMPSLIAA